MWLPLSNSEKLSDFRYQTVSSIMTTMNLEDQPDKWDYTSPVPRSMSRPSSFGKARIHEAQIFFLSRRALTCYLSWAMSHPLIRFTLRCYPWHKWNGWLGHFSFLHQYRLGSQDCPCNGYSVLSRAPWNLAWIYHFNNEKIFTFSHHCIVTDFPITCSGWLYYGITICSLH